jgi:septal ring factor EnvC (AmiA/AmiB activator)
LPKIKKEKSKMIDLSDIQNFKANEISNKKIEKLRAEQAKTEQKLADAEREIQQGENKIKRLTNSLSAAERKARTKRLIERGAIAESFVPNAAALSNDEFKDALATAFRATN